MNLNEVGMDWDEGYEQLNHTEQKAADWLIQHNENIAEMVQAYLNSLSPEEIEDL